jgi:hypothetical protein
MASDHSASRTSTETPTKGQRDPNRDIVSLKRKQGKEMWQQTLANRAAMEQLRSRENRIKRLEYEEL